jgi:hypothetical protein
MAVYSDGKIRNAVRLLAVIGSSILPILSIVVLYVITSQTARLGCIVTFSALCSATLATLSNAKNVEIIAATAAYVLLLPCLLRGEGYTCIDAFSLTSCVVTQRCKWSLSAVIFLRTRVRPSDHGIGLRLFTILSPILGLSSFIKVFDIKFAKSGLERSLMSRINTHHRV